MKINIKTEGRNISIPLPMWLLKAGIKISTVVGKNKEGKSEQVGLNVTVSNLKKSCSMKYVDMIDYKVLKEAMDELEAYKGMAIVEVYSNDGTEVLITV